MTTTNFAIDLGPAESLLQLDGSSLLKSNLDVQGRQSLFASIMAEIRVARNWGAPHSFIGTALDGVLPDRMCLFSRNQPDLPEAYCVSTAWKVHRPGCGFRLGIAKPQSISIAFDEF